MFLSRKNAFILLLFIFAGSLLLTGCMKHTPVKSTVNSTRTSKNSHSGTPHPSIAKPEGTTPLQLLQQTVAVYQSARTYSDHGEIRIIGKMSDPNEEPAPWGCTVCFERPGKLRLEINDGKFVSDGENCFAQIRTLPGQVLFRRTPEHWTLEEIFRDVYFEGAMNLGIPETILCFAPQLILLFAEEPLKTLLPEDASAELLETQKMGETVCDLIRIKHRSGSWVLWLNRQNHALVRFDYLVEGLAVPEGVESIRQVRIDMPDADFDKNVASEAFLMEQPQDARQVSEFQSPEAPELSAQRQEEHQKQLRLMTESGVFAIRPSSKPIEVNQTQRPAPAKMPKTFRLTEKWRQSLAGIENIEVFQQEIFIPCEGNLLARIDADGKIIQKIQPKGFQDDELLTRIRTATDGTGKLHIGASSVSGQTVHLFDEKLMPIPRTAVTSALKEQAVVSDFQFVRFPNGTLAVLSVLLSLDSEQGDRLQLTALDGKELWRDSSVLSPFLVHTYFFNGKQGALVLSVQEQQSLLLNYDIQGQMRGALPFTAEREILWFSVPDTNDGNDDWCIGLIHSDREGKDVRLAGVNFEGTTLWEHPLQPGEYQKPIDQIIIGDLLGETGAERLVPLPDGTVFVFARNGTLLDTLSFGRVLTGLGVMKTDSETLLFVADTVGITAYLVSESP